MKDKRQELRNNFDDAYLALLMDELCEEEGALLWEECEQLNADPEAAVPESLHKKCVDIIEHHYAQERRRQRRGKSRAVIRKILIAAAVMIMLLSTAFAIVEEFRLSVLNFALDMHEKYSTLIFEMDSEKKDDNAGQDFDSYNETVWFGNNQIAVNFDLNAFKILENRCNDNSVYAYLFAEETGQSIAIYSTKIVEGMNFQVDTEHVDSTIDVQINGNPGYMIIKNGRNHITWSDVRNGVILEVVTNGMVDECSIKLAESTVYVSSE